MTVQEALARLLDGRDLSQSAARDVMGDIMEGKATPAQIGGLLVALRLKGETAAEIAGCAEAMRAHVLAVKPKRADLVDTAGTGGDGAGTFIISTAAALVAAAAGAGVAKHGNRAISSSSGSADVLEALGFELELPAERIERSIDELGFGFLFAPSHHPAMRHAAPVRRELAAPSSFTAPAGSTSSPPPGRTSSARSPAARFAAARSTRGTSEFRAAGPLTSRGARPRRTRGLFAKSSRAPRARSARPSYSTQAGPSRPAGTRETSRRAIGSRARRSTRALPASGSTS